MIKCQKGMDKSDITTALFMFFTIFEGQHLPYALDICWLNIVPWQNEPFIDKWRGRSYLLGLNCVNVFLEKRLQLKGWGKSVDNIDNKSLEHTFISQKKERWEYSP